MVRKLALALLSLQIVCLAAGLALQWLLQIAPENSGYTWLLLGSIAPSLLVIGLLGGAVFFGGMRAVSGVLQAVFTPFRSRR